MKHVLFGHNPGNMIGEFDDEAEALAIVRELLEGGWSPDDLSLGPPPSQDGTSPVLTGPELAARAGVPIPPAADSASPPRRRLA